MLPGSSMLLASAATSRLLAIALGVGLVALFVLQAVLLWTRWGQARPVAKCVLLSLFAHVLLIVYAWSTHVLFCSPGSWSGNSTVRVRLADATDEIDAALLVGEMPAELSQAGADAGTAAALPEPSHEQQPAEKAAVPDLIDPPPPAPPPVEVAATSPPTDSEASPVPAEVPLATSLPAPETQTASAAEPAASKTDPAEINAADPDSAAPQFTTAPAAQPRRIGDGAAVPEPLRGRIASDRLQIAQQFGATPSTEAAVAAALDWLARVQSADGRWDADAFGAGRETRTLGHDRQGAGARADTGISGLALLALLGNGETHLTGKHRETIQRGLEFLLASQRTDGCLAGDAEFFASTYCHGMATLALSEAYALSGDERLLPGLKSALQFTIASQHSAGGWRYKPYDAGDMSQFGWQLMSLKSAEVGGIAIPQTTRGRMVRFLRECSSGRNRGLAGYRPGDRVSRTMTAEALVCRYFLGAENSPAALDEASAYIGEERPGIGQPNYYYWYYGTLALFQRQGDDWLRWNAAMQKELLGRQRLDGELAGSWDADDQWGGYGGRVYSTALAALSLEVYYRYLPIYGNNDPRDRLTDRPLQPVPR